MITGIHIKPGIPRNGTAKIVIETITTRPRKLFRINPTQASRDRLACLIRAIRRGGTKFNAIFIDGPVPRIVVYGPHKPDANAKTPPFLRVA